MYYRLGRSRDNHVDHALKAPDRLLLGSGLIFRARHALHGRDYLGLRHDVAPR